MAKKSSEERDPMEKEPDNHQEKGNKGHADTGAQLGSQAKEAVEKVYHMAKNMQRDTATYIALAIGLVLLYWQPLWGGAIVGVIFGIYFFHEMLPRVKSFRTYLQSEGQAKSIVLAGTVVVLLFLAPGFVLGALAAMGVLSLLARCKE
jgi:hypothetical protein